MTTTPVPDPGGAGPEGQIHILLVEDNPGDVRLTQEAFREGRIANTMHVVTDGEEALRYLHRTGEYTDAMRPDLVLLDLNLPRVDGRVVLAEVKQDPELRRIPVVILTTSAAEADILSSYDLHANSYVTKPLDLEEFLRAVMTIEDFWLSLVRLPRGRAGSLGAAPTATADAAVPPRAGVP